MGAIIIRVDHTIKKPVKRYNHLLEWVVRKAIIRELKELESRGIAEALLVDEKLEWKAPPGWDLKEVVRSWRR